MASGFAMVSPMSTLRGGREAWKVVVRVLRIWESAPIGDPANPYALQLLLVDAEVCVFHVYPLLLCLSILFGACNDFAMFHDMQGGKIEAVAEKSLIQKF